MSGGGYIWSGVGSGIVGMLLFGMAATNDSVQAAMKATGAHVDTSADATMQLLGGAFLVAAVVLVLIGAIRVGTRSD